MSNALIAEQIADSVIIRFNRPEVRSPLSMSVLDEIERVLDRMEKSTRRIVLTGVGDVFASGADLREIAEIDGKAAKSFARRGQRLMNRIAAEPRQTIALVNGYCYGGALDLALACKKRIALPGASFCHPGTRIGIITGWGGTQRLPRLIGEGNALEMFFTAEPIGAERALAIGLIDSIAGSIEDGMCWVDEG